MSLILVAVLVAGIWVVAASGSPTLPTSAYTRLQEARNARAAWIVVGMAAVTLAGIVGEALWRVRRPRLRRQSAALPGFDLDAFDPTSQLGALDMRP